MKVLFLLLFSFSASAQQTEPTKPTEPRDPRLAYISDYLGERYSRYIENECGNPSCFNHPPACNDQNTQHLYRDRPHEVLMALSRSILSRSRINCYGKIGSLECCFISLEQRRDPNETERERTILSASRSSESPLGESLETLSTPRVYNLIPHSQGVGMVNFHIEEDSNRVGVELRCSGGDENTTLGDINALLRSNTENRIATSIGIDPICELPYAERLVASRQRGLNRDLRNVMIFTNPPPVSGKGDAATHRNEDRIAAPAPNTASGTDINKAPASSNASSH